MEQKAATRPLFFMEYGVTPSFPRKRESILTLLHTLGMDSRLRGNDVIGCHAAAS